MNLLYAAPVTVLLLLAQLPLQAADTAFYGKAHVSLDQLDNDIDSGFNISSNSSRIGVKVSHQLQPGLKVISQIEATVKLDEGGDGSNFFNTRDSFVGLQGRYGLARLGYFDTPMKKVRSRTDFFGDKVGDARNIVAGAGVSLDKRFRNGIHYQTPKLHNFILDLHYSANDATGSTTDNENDAISSSITYHAADLLVILAYEHQNQISNPQGQPVPAKTGIRLGTRYKVNEAWQLALFYQHSSNFNDADRTAWGVGLGYNAGDYNLTAQYYLTEQTANRQDKATMLALGIDKSLGQSLNFYMAFALTHNAEQANFNVSAGGHNKRLDISPGADPMAISIGSIYTF